MADTLTVALSRPITFAQMPIEQVLQSVQQGNGVAAGMFEHVGYSADIAGLEREFGRTLTKIPVWARRHVTQGELS